MTPTTLPFDAALPLPVAGADRNSRLTAHAAPDGVWALLNEDFARFFPSPQSARDIGECTMDSPSL
jgi:hypothetical protein